MTDGLLPPEPSPRDDHGTWAAYAIRRGIPADVAQGLTRDQIRSAMAPSAPIGGAPDLERHERDPETLAAHAPVRF